MGTGPCSTVDLRGYRLLDREGYLNRSSPTRVVVRSVPAWAAVPAGTRIVIYNGAPAEAGDFPPNVPFDELDFSDHWVSIPHTNTDFFENVAWGGFGNAGDYVVLVDGLGNPVDGLSYGNRTGEATSPDVQPGTVGANAAAWFTGGSTALINDSACWATGSESGGASSAQRRGEHDLAELPPPPACGLRGPLGPRFRERARGRGKRSPHGDGGEHRLREPRRGNGVPDRGRPRGVRAPKRRGLGGHDSAHKPPHAPGRVQADLAGGEGCDSPDPLECPWEPRGDSVPYGDGRALPFR